MKVNQTDGLTRDEFYASAKGSQAITASDTVDIPAYQGQKATRGLYVGVGGDIKMTMADGVPVTRKNVVGGITHPWSVTRIWSTGTTATDMIGDY